VDPLVPQGPKEKIDWLGPGSNPADMFGETFAILPKGKSLRHRGIANIGGAAGVRTLLHSRGHFEASSYPREAATQSRGDVRTQAFLPPICSL
jgi:hypothetical protein